MAIADRKELRLCLESIQIHYALEATIEKCRQQPGPDRRAAVAAGRQGRARPVSAASEFRGRRRKARRLSQSALEEATLQFRISPSELVSIKHLQADVGAEYR